MMKSVSFLKRIALAFDPKRDIEKEAPRPFLLAKYAVEYLFKLVGFFLLLSLVVGLTYSACPQNPILLAFPLFLAMAFFFYIAITTFGIPVFYAIGKIDNSFIRRSIGYLTIALMFAFSAYSVSESPIFELLEIYVGKLFLAAYDCKWSPLER